MNRALLKQDAKNAMSMARPHPALTTLAYIAVSLAANMIISAVSAIFGLSGAVLESGEISLVGLVVTFALSIIISLLLGAVAFGYQAYCLKVFKQEETGVNELFAYFPKFIKIFGLTLWMELFIMLWSMLFVVPGFIAGLRYSQAVFVMIENPDMSIRECVNESKRLMSGRLWEFFVLTLSFILWDILSAITCGIAGLYVQPYMTVTYAGYYLSLKPAENIPGYADAE